MYRESLTLCTLVALCAYLLLTMGLGPTGLVAHQSTRRLLDTIESDLSVVTSNAERLEATIESLRRDREALSIEARAIGLAHPTERVLRGATLPRDTSASVSPGTVPRRMPDVVDHRPLFRAISVVVALGSLALTLLVRR